MTSIAETNTEARAFRVHARHLDSHDARTVREASFEAAAVAYLEDLHAIGTTPDIEVIVRDQESGHQHCFRIDLETGEAQACG